MDDSLLQDLRFGVRLLTRSPGFAVVAVLTLALGIGANTAIFSVVNAVLLNPFPYADPDRIMVVDEYMRTPDNRMSVAYPDYLDWQKQQQVFEHMGVARNLELTITGDGEPAQVPGAAISAQVFPLLGMEPVLGRVFTERDDRPGADRVVVLGHGLWVRRFGADRGVLGRTVLLDNQAYTVIGVMPPRFQFWAGQYYVPVALNFEGEFQTNRVARTGNLVVGKLKPGVSIAEAQAAMNVIAKRLGQAYPDSNKDVGVFMEPLTRSVVQGIRPALLVLLGAVALLLLIACANVANLLLARAAVRERELAIRGALGAGRGRMIRQMLLESVPLALLGALGGLALTWGGLRVLLAMIPPSAIPIEAQVRVDLRVLVFTLTLAVATAVIFGLIPALQATRREATESLKDGARGMSGGRDRSRVRNALVVAEVALSLTLLIGAGLLINSFQRLQWVNPGFRPENVLRMRVSLPATKYAEIDRAEQFFEQLVERGAGLPGATAVGASSSTPFSNFNAGLPVVTEGVHYTSLQELPFASYTLVMGDYFKALGMTLTRGRALGAADGAQAPKVTVINEAFAKRHFPDKDPIGQRVLLGLPENLNKEGLLPPGFERLEWLTVVGIVADTRRFQLSQAPQPEAFIPYAQAPPIQVLRGTMFLTIRTARDPLKLVGAAREQVWALDRDQPIAEVTTMTSALAESLRQPRFSTILLSVFALVALALAAIGVYGVMSYSVAQRTREVGIRMALGAERSDVLRGVLGRGMALAGVGVALGLAGAFALSRVLGSLLYEVSATDPTTFVAVASLLTLVALVACLVPARRATLVDPLTALRAE